MPSPKDTDVGELLRRLSDAGVEFIVVGGAAAVLHGAPITTEDLDIVLKLFPSLQENDKIRILIERFRTLRSETGPSGPVFHPVSVSVSVPVPE